MTDQTPSSKSVVVPRHPTEAMLKAGRLDGVFANSAANAVYQAMLVAAPVPSGGEVRGAIESAVRNASRGQWSDGLRVGSAKWCSGLTDAILAALTPRHEAPADHHEQNLTASNAELIEQALSHPPLEAREGVKYTIRQEYGFGITEHDPALTPRHEAPAEGAGEDGDWIEWSGGDNPVPGKMVELRRQYSPRGGVFDSVTPSPSEDHNWKHDREMFGNGANIIAYRIRARSSAPDALGNLLAVIHGDGGHRTLEVGVEQAAAEAEKIVADLLSSAPEAREGEACSNGHQPGCDCDVAEEDVARSKPAPAAPSADKLRVLDAVGDYLIKQYGKSYGLHHPVDRARILAALEGM